MRASVVAVVAISACAAVSSASGSTGKRVLSLEAHPRQCLIGTADVNAQTVLVVPCSDPAHNLEVYAIRHGGWGDARPPAPRVGFAIARTTCRLAFERLTGHAIPPAAGWQWRLANTPTETARYADKIVCSYRAWPRLTALGSGWHVR
jgi:hypothetical protein